MDLFSYYHVKCYNTKTTRLNFDSNPSKCQEKLYYKSLTVQKGVLVWKTGRCVATGHSISGPKKFKDF